MFAKITSVSKLEGVLAPYWEFEYAFYHHGGTTMYGTLSSDQVLDLAGRTDAGAIFDMCRAISRTVPSDFSWLVGRVFYSANAA